MPIIAIRIMKKHSVLILGAQSDIAKSIAKKFGENNYNLVLAAKNIDELKIQSTAEEDI